MNEWDSANSWKTFETKKSYYTLSASKRSVILLKQLKVKQNFPESWIWDRSGMGIDSAWGVSTEPSSKALPETEIQSETNKQQIPLSFISFFFNLN